MHTTPKYYTHRIQLTASLPFLPGDCARAEATPEKLPSGLGKEIKKTANEV